MTSYLPTYDLTLPFSHFFLEQNHLQYPPWKEPVPIQIGFISNSHKMKNVIHELDIYSFFFFSLTL